VSDIGSGWPDYPGKRPPKNRGAAKPTTPISDRPDLKGKVYRIKGVDVELFTIGELAGAVQRKPVTLRMWESSGWIPKSNWRSPTPQGTQIPGKTTRGRRLYSRSQVELVVSAVEMFNINDQRRADWAAFREHIKKHWLDQ
jgi:hypothetical protein